jgi:beta-glucosidase
MSRVASDRPGRFPDGFLWGAATASHQVEGDNRWNDWWQLEQSGRLPHRSGDACRHYELYESDFDLAKSLGHNAHRLSIEWSRIEPCEGEWNDEALEHYAAVIAALRRRDIEPIVTLHHFTNPAWFARRGGWTRADSVESFARCVDVVAARLAGQVKYWLTINEPTVYVKHAYVSCDWPPCGQRSWWKAARSLRNLCRAHGAAYRVLHRHRSDAMVGFAHSAPHVVPCDPQSVADRIAARARDFVLNDLVFQLLGRKPREVLDFIGINYYARQVVSGRTDGGYTLPFGCECTADHHGAPRVFTPLGWEFFAAGLGSVLRKFSRYGVPLIITENGIATTDEALRARFLAEHLDRLTEAVHAGIDIRGYLYWTLMDNYEWTAGRDARFGLAAVDFGTQRREPRPAAKILRDYIDAASS